ncbi:ABC transporter permease [Metabacillus lacus]|nr:ABC transporter permease [Metabacillus lacus]
MKNIHDIWTTRLHAHVTEVRAYLRYMMNDHLLFVLIFLGAGGALWYQDWLSTLDESFPAVWIMTFVFAAVTVKAAVRTLLKEPDLVFLLPLEMKMDEYFKKAKVYSFFSGLYPLLLLGAGLAPLYFAVTDATGIQYLLIFLQLLAIRSWNMMLSWKISFLQEPFTGLFSTAVRFALNAAVIYFILQNAYLFALAVYLIMLLLYLYISLQAKGKGIKWDYLIRQEYLRKQAFYRLANLFTDVPKLRKQAKRRAYLDPVLRLISYNRENVYQYLYARAFLRSSDYFGVFARLTVIFAVLIVSLSPGEIAAPIFSLAVIYITGIQLIGLYQHFDMLTLPDLYPAALAHRKPKFLQVLLFVLSVQAVLLSIAVLVAAGVTAFLFSLLGGMLFAFVFVRIYVAKRLKRFGVQ